MMSHLNSLLIEGVLVNDPELVASVKAKPDVKLVKFTIASDYNCIGSDGSKKKDTLFLTVQVWGVLAERCLKKVEMGFTVRCVGKLKSVSLENGQSAIELLAKHIEYRRPTKSNLVVLEDDNNEENEE